MAITRSKTTKQVKPKVKRLSKQAPIQSRTEKESIVNDDSTGSHGILSIRSSPGPFDYLLDEWDVAKDRENDSDVENFSDSSNITASSPVPKQSGNVKYCFSNCKIGQKHDKSLIRCCLCMQNFHQMCVSEKSSIGSGTVWNCLKCRELPGMVRNLSSQISALQLAISTVSQVSVRLEEKFVVKLEECKRLSEENRRLNSIVKSHTVTVMDSESDDDDCPLLVESQLSDRFSRKKSIKHATSQKTEKRRPKRNVKNDGDQSSLFYHGRCPEKVQCDSYYSDPVQTHKKYTEANEISRKMGSVRPTYSQVVKGSNNYKPGSTTGYNRKRGDRKTYNSFHRNQMSAPDSNRTSTYRHSHYDK